jgi:hypothetical protein
MNHQGQPVIVGAGPVGLEGGLNSEMQLTAGLKLNCRRQAQGFLRVISAGRPGKMPQRPVRGLPSIRRQTWL